MGQRKQILDFCSALSIFFDFLQTRFSKNVHKKDLDFDVLPFYWPPTQPWNYGCEVKNTIFKTSPILMAFLRDLSNV